MEQFIMKGGNPLVGEVTISAGNLGGIDSDGRGCFNRKSAGRA